MAGLAALTGVGAALAILPGRAAALRPRDVCVLDCPGTTTTSTSTPTPPSAGPVTVSNLTPTSATFTAQYSGGSDDSQYRFDVSTAAGEPWESTPWADQIGGMPAITADAPITGLEPNQRYSVLLGWTYARGASNPYGAATEFTTPIAPAAEASLTLGRRAITIGQNVTLTASARGNPLSVDAELQDATMPFHDYRPFEIQGVGPADVISIPANGSDPVTVEPTRNESLRVVLPGTHGNAQIERPSRSNSVFLYVFPTAGVSLNRVNDSARVEAAFNVNVHGVRRGFRGETVYFYRSSSAHAVGHLIGHAGLRAGPTTYDQAQLGAQIFFTDPNTFYIGACVRHAVLPDMGVPFTDRACGRPTYRG